MSASSNVRVSSSARAAPEGRAQRSSARARIEPLGLGVAGLVVVAAALQILPTTGVVDPRFLPPLSVVGAELSELTARPAFWSALGSTVWGWLLGLVIAIVAGTTLGILIAGVPLLRALLAPTVEFLRPIPSVVWVPLAVLLLGTTSQATLLIVVYASVWPILIQVMYGVEAVDTVAVDTARTYRVKRLRVARSVVWPSIQPYLFVGIRLSATIALLLEITGELIIGSPGLGRLITVAQQSGAIASMYALVWVSAVLGVLVGVAARFLENRAMYWHASIRAAR